jgi:hypothetical protein
MQLRSTSKGYSKATFAALPGTVHSIRWPSGNVESSAVKNKRQAERRAREIEEFIQRENWEALAKLHDDGVIDDDEFEKRKRVALGEQSESE